MNNSKRILIVDDERSMARAIERSLTIAGYETAVATNGFEAAAKLFTFQPDVMVMDLRMPGVDGIGVLRYMQTAEFPISVKTLVVSADTEDRLREASELGACATLRKPFEPAELIDAVVKLLSL
jgi:CheY-like chemotaxis protein